MNHAKRLLLFVFTATVSLSFAQDVPRDLVERIVGTRGEVDFTVGSLGVPLSLASFVVLTFATTFFWLVSAFTLLGLGFGFLFPGFISGATLAVDDHEQGAVAGLTGLVTGVGSMIGPLFGTVLYQIEMVVPYLASAGLLLVLTGFVFADPRLRRSANV